MFNPQTDRLTKLAAIFPERIVELEKIFAKSTNIYLDYANMYHWSERLHWRINPKRLIQLLHSFPSIKNIRFYQGSMPGNNNSQLFIDEMVSLGYKVTSKPVKIMRLSIDVSGIPPNSPAVLDNFIKKPLLRQLNIETIEYLNGKLKELNKKGMMDLEMRKCNFDVEIGRDMLLDYSKSGTETFILWSGDSDFADPVSQLMRDKKSVFIFATARRVAVELSQTKAPIYDIQKIRNFICDPEEIQMEAKRTLASP